MVFIFQNQKLGEGDNCFIVEGYTDVVIIKREKVENVVSETLNISRIDQLNLIGRLTKNITLLFDGDIETDLEASSKVLTLFLKEGMNVKVVMFPQGEDTDHILRSCHKKTLQIIYLKTLKILSI